MAVAVPALAASSPPKVDVPHKLRKFIPKVKEKSGLPVLLPQKMWTGLRPSRLFASGGASEGSYSLGIEAAPHCGGANACFIASFNAQRGAQPSFKHKVELTHGITGYFQKVQCGASCAPAFIQWKEFGVLYEIENKAVGKHEKRWMVKLANSAIRHGPR